MPDALGPNRRLILAAALGGALLFAASLAYFLFVYLTAFAVPAGPWTSGPGLRAIAVDVVLFALFALHHSWLARSGVKARLHATAGPALERIAYVWIASTLFLVVCYGWQPVPGTLWQAQIPWSAVVVAVQTAGVCLTGAAARRMDVFELAGLRQAFARGPRPAVLLTDGIYGWVRHPIYLGWILVVWAVPVMTGTRAVFALVSSLYLAIAVVWEERELERSFGAAYATYRRRVRWRFVPFVY